MPPFRLSAGSSIRPRRPSSLHNRSCHLDRRDCAELPVPLLHLRDGDRRVGAFADQGSVFGDEVVHGADPLLVYMRLDKKLPSQCHRDPLQQKCPFAFLYIHSLPSCFPKNS